MSDISSPHTPPTLTPTGHDSYSVNMRRGSVITECESTQDELKRSPPEVDWVVARSQSRGRGRRGKTWVSPPSGGLYLSWRPPPSLALSTDLLPAVSLAAGVAAARWLEKIGARVELKWPNDLYLGGEKLGGVLCEAHHDVSASATSGAAPWSVIVGIGINVRASAQLPANTTTLEHICDAENRSSDLKYNLERDDLDLAQELINSLESEYRALITGGWSGVLTSWRRYELPLDTPLARVLNGAWVRGLYRGVDARGALLLSMPGGELLTIQTGEVSLCSVIS